MTDMSHPAAHRLVHATSSSVPPAAAAGCTRDCASTSGTQRTAVGLAVHLLGGDESRSVLPASDSADEMADVRIPDCDGQVQASAPTSVSVNSACTGTVDHRGQCSPNPADNSLGLASNTTTPHLLNSPNHAERFCFELVVEVKDHPSQQKASEDESARQLPQSLQVQANSIQQLKDLLWATAFPTLRGIATRLPVNWREFRTQRPSSAVLTAGASSGSSASATMQVGEVPEELPACLTSVQAPSEQPSSGNVPVNSDSGNESDSVAPSSEYRITNTPPTINNFSRYIYFLDGSRRRHYFQEPCPRGELITIRKLDRWTEAYRRHTFGSGESQMPASGGESNPVRVERTPAASRGRGASTRGRAMRVAERGRVSGTVGGRRRGRGGSVSVENGQSESNEMELGSERAAPYTPLTLIICRYGNKIRTAADWKMICSSILLQQRVNRGGAPVEQAIISMVEQLQQQHPTLEAMEVCWRLWAVIILSMKETDRSEAIEQPPPDVLKFFGRQSLSEEHLAQIRRSMALLLDFVQTWEEELPRLRADAQMLEARIRALEDTLATQKRIALAFETMLQPWESATARSAAERVHQRDMPDIDH